MAAQLHFGVGDSLGFGTTGTPGSGTATFAKSAISNMVVGDLLVAWIHSQSSGIGDTITPPAGWTHYGAAIGSPTNNASRTSGIYYLALTSQALINSLSATFTWSFTNVTTRVACVVARATGIDLDNIEDAAATAFTSTNTATVNLASITTVNATTLLVGAVQHQNAASTSSPMVTSFMTAFQEYKTSPSGSTNANSGAALGYSYLTSAGATGTIAAVIDSTPAALGGELVAFKAGTWAGAPNPNPGIDAKFTSATDTLTTGKLYYTSATDTLSTPLEIRPVSAGYSTVTNMLATTPFYVAHRGGSADWPEMSLHAYTQSVFWGMGAVELSLARTSDGVWFGLHDASLDRTTLNTGGGSGTTLVASSLTWAQVQTYTINYPSVVNSSSLPQPYMRWEELMDAYYNTHIIFVDPKVATAFSSELLNMMDAMPGTPTERFIGKSYGVAGNVGNTTGWAHDLTARGYKSWGYFYQADAANFATYQGRWDTLGMDYGADQPTWDSIKSYGKLVIGHIIPNAAAATTAFTKGADALMVSGVQEAVTRKPSPSQA